MAWCIMVIFIVSTAMATNSRQSKVDDSYRLPSNIHPIRYTITIEPTLEPSLEKGTFNGSVVIELRVLKNSKNVTIHSRDLNINENSIAISNSNGPIIRPINTTIDTMRQFYIINLEDKISENEDYNLTIGEFSGDVNFDNVGFYLAKYNDRVGKEKVLAVTDFQPAGARKAFPCFDEPGLKAKFNIVIIRSGKYNSVSNEKLTSTINLGNDRFKDTYKETVAMSTYLVAFAVSEYGHTVQNGRLRIFAKPEAIENGRADYVLSISEEFLQAMEEFTNVNYTLSKLDLFAVPSNFFEPDGMENWGLITYREPYLLCSNASTVNLQNCMTFTGHELVHQWFGNLVTPSWWQYMWLSEGFATYLQYYITSTVRPKWKLMDQFVVIVQQKVMDYDGNTIKQPLNQNPQVVGGLPSTAIAYYKGACVIRMLRHVLTHSIFKAGLRTYLRKRQFGVVDPSNLYEAFQQAVDEANANELLGNLTVSSILKTWDSAIGYPLVTVSRNYNNGSATFTQNKFFPRSIFEFNRVWNIPINSIFYSEGEPNYSKTTADFWLTEKTATINNLPTDDWMLINKLQTGYYRVNYDLTNWQRITAFVNTANFTKIHVLNRAQLIDDAFALAKWNYISFEIPLNLSRYLIQEKEYVPLAAFLNIIDHLNIFMRSSEKYNLFQNYIMQLLSGVYDYLGHDERDEDTHLDKLNRINILKWCCYLGHPECRNAGLSKLRKWMSESVTSVSADLDSILFCGAVKVGTKDDLNFLNRKYEESVDPDRKNNIFLSLMCSEDKSNLNNLLDIIFNTTNSLSIRERQVAFAKIVESGNTGLQTAFNYVTEHFLTLNEIFSKTKVAESLGKRIVTWEYINRLNLIKDTVGDVGRVITICILYAQRNINWLTEGFIEQILKWLDIY